MSEWWIDSNSELEGWQWGQDSKVDVEYFYPEMLKITASWKAISLVFLGEEASHFRATSQNKTEMCH
jgi:hypothetical protein